MVSFPYFKVLAKQFFCQELFLFGASGWRHGVITAPIEKNVFLVYKVPLNTLVTRTSFGRSRHSFSLRKKAESEEHCSNLMKEEDPKLSFKKICI